MQAVTTPPLDARLMNWAASALFALSVVIVCAGVVYWGANHPVWNVRGITVTGEVTHQNAVTVRAYLASRLHGTFLTVNLQQAKQQFESMPWVREAVVRREFPNRLSVEIKEHQAVAWWGEAGGGKLVNAQGQVFEANPDDPQSDGWSELIGPQDHSAQVFELFQRLQPVFARMDREIQRLELNARGSWRTRLDNGAVIELGRGTTEEVIARAEGFASTAGQLIQRYGRRDLEAADLRYPNGYAVRMRGVSTLPDGKPGTPSSKR